MTGELAKTIDELLQAYFDGDYSRGDIYSRILALVPVHGADAVFEALPPPWRRTFYDWARDTLGGDAPIDELITIGSSAPDNTAVDQIRTWLAAHPEPPADPPTPPEIEDYYVLTEDQIDFSTLDATTLFHLATQRTEPFIATSALGALAGRKTREARDAAETILVGRSGIAFSPPTDPDPLRRRSIARARVDGALSRRERAGDPRCDGRPRAREPRRLHERNAPRARDEARRACRRCRAGAAFEARTPRGARGSLRIELEVSMAIWIHVLCRSAEPVTYGELVDVMGHMGWLDEAARFEPPLTDTNRADFAWGSFRVEYAPSKRPITVHHRLTKEEMEPAFEDIQEMLDGVEDVVRRGDIAARLEQTRQMFVFEVPDDLPQDVWEMLDAAETHLARERDGIIVAQQGVFDGDMNQLVAFDTA